MNNLEMIGFYKYGGIHIKPENRGKFTKSAKAAGKSVQEHARDVVNNPNSTELQRKRALFAINAKKFKHQKGNKLCTKHQEGGWLEILPGFGTYYSGLRFFNDPSLKNFGWMVADGVGDALFFTGLGTAVKGLRALNTARKSYEGIQNARLAKRLLRLLLMLERGEKGKNAFKGWVLSGNNLRNAERKVKEANRELLKGLGEFGIGLVQTPVTNFIENKVLNELQ